MHRIEIRNFGPIDHIELDVNDFMVFIGPQASGKSTVAKAIYFFRMTKDWLKELSFDSGIFGMSDILAEFVAKLTECFHDFWDKSFISNDFLLKYHYSSDYWLVIKRHENANDLLLEFSPAILSLFKASEEIMGRMLDEILPEVKEGGNRLLFGNFRFTSQLNSLLEGIVDEVFGRDKKLTRFIPVGRITLASIDNKIRQFDPSHLDYFTKQFIPTINYLHSYFHPEKWNSVQKIEVLKEGEKVLLLARDLMRSILKGEYKYDSFEDRIQLDNGLNLHLSNTSSGQQESVWILNLIYLYLLRKTKACLIIEEPEAHLHPEAQRDLINLIALFANQNGNQVILTTHSPYILAAVNNLTVAHRMATKYDREKEANAIIPKECWLDFKRVYAGFVEKGGIRPILDDEFAMIKNEEIDTASTIMNAEFDALLELRKPKNA